MYIHTYIHVHRHTHTVIIIIVTYNPRWECIGDNKLGCTDFLWWEVSTSLLVNEATKPQDY